MRDFYNAIADAGQPYPFGSPLMGGVVPPYYWRWDYHPVQPLPVVGVPAFLCDPPELTGEAAYFAECEADFNRDFPDPEKTPEELERERLAIQHVPTLAIGSYDDGEVSNLYAQLPRFLSNNVVRVLVPTDPETLLCTMGPEELATALEHIAEYIRAGGIEPRLAGVPHPLETDEVFTGTLAKQIADIYRGEAAEDAEWGMEKGIEWTV
jgi:hypothetical protein